MRLDVVKFQASRLLRLPKRKGSSSPLRTPASRRAAAPRPWPGDGTVGRDGGLRCPLPLTGRAGAAFAPLPSLYIYRSDEEREKATWSARKTLGPRQDR